jgi:hypothetical protein
MKTWLRGIARPRHLIGVLIVCLTNPGGIKQGRVPQLSELLNRRLTETAQFVEDADIFMVSG